MPGRGPSTRIAAARTQEARQNSGSWRQRAARKVVSKPTIFSSFFTSFRAKFGGRKGAVRDAGRSAPFCTTRCSPAAAKTAPMFDRSCVGATRRRVRSNRQIRESWYGAGSFGAPRPADDSVYDVANRRERAAQWAAGAGRACESRTGLGVTGLESVQHSYFMAPVR
jgi:hypothetical protein